MKKERNLSIELLRIYSMFFIVAGHVTGYMAQAGVLQNNPSWIERVLSALSGGMGTCAVDLFVLITGYFLITSTALGVRRFLTIYVETVFYLVSITVIFLLSGQATWVDLAKSFFPLAPTKFGYWFVTKYLGLILLAPFLSRLALSLSKRQYEVLLLILLLLNTTLAYGFPLGNLYGGGWTLMWFICLYFVAGYLRLHGNSGVWMRRSLWLIAYVIGVIAWASIQFFGVKQVALDYHSVITFCIAFSLFVLTKNTRITDSRLIRFFAPNTFGVYLIHQHNLIIGCLVAVLSISYNGGGICSAWVIGGSIYVVCTLIDKLRVLLFDVLKISNLYMQVEKKMEALFK